MSIEFQHPCSECPWRIANQGQPNDPNKFYTKGNLKRLWQGMRSGNAPGMSCHPTDARMAEFPGYERTAELTKDYRECAGAVILLQRELQRFSDITEKSANPKRSMGEYLVQHPAGLKRDGFRVLVERVLLGHTPLSRAFPIVDLNDQEIGYAPLIPWEVRVTPRTSQ